MNAATESRPAGRLGAARRATASALRHPLLPWALGAALSGALGFSLFGTTPGRSGREVTPPASWALAVPAAPSTAEAQALLASRATWASQPIPAVQAGAVALPPPRLVAIVGGRGAARTALFETPEGVTLRLARGETLPGQGEIMSIDTTSVRWRGAGGTIFEARLFLHPESIEVPPPRSTSSR